MPEQAITNVIAAVAASLPSIDPLAPVHAMGRSSIIFEAAEMAAECGEKIEACKLEATEAATRVQKLESNALSDSMVKAAAAVKKVGYERLRPETQKRYTDAASDEIDEILSQRKPKPLRQNRQKRQKRKQKNPGAII